MTASIDAQTSDILLMLDAFGPETPQGEWDHAMIEATVHAAAEFARDTLVPINPVGDAEGCRLENGKVRVPEAFEAAYPAYLETGLHLLGLPAAFGGLEAPAPVQAGVSEIMSGANHAFQMLVGLVPGAAHILAHGFDEARAAELFEPIVEGTCLATMCLTEPDAGSELPNLRCAAEEEDGVWKITGNKIFISGGGQSLSEDILHLVLARSGTREDGRAELSLFAVPQSPAVKVTRLEEKSGLHASPTCAMSFEGAEGELVGKPGGGLAAMFPMMNHARIDVALQGVGHAAAVTGIAKEYAETRVQGRGAEGRRVPIDQHGDVRRMLAEMDTATLSIRAMCQWSLHADNAAILDFLTPVIKAHATDTGLAVIDMGIQVLGGYGYLPEYGIEQHWRDARITRIYEGTNGIMAMTLATRLLGNEKLVDGFVARVSASAEAAEGPFAPALQAGLTAWKAAAELVANAADKGLPASAFLSLTGELWALCSLNEFARRAGSAASERLSGLDGFASARAETEFARLLSRVRTLSGPDAL